ncbi:MAG TPA: biotin/lipoate A/B protein ligase family protein, partial [bacterium]|nr:biotin/lipoate A/B protein ligase family protein [bacterium]
VFHEREITYSMAVPADWFSGGIEGSYADICGAMAEGLGFFQKDFEFSPVNDIIYKDKKVSGSAQARRGGYLLQHGTVLLETDLEKMFALLKVPVEKTRRHGLDAPRRRVATLSEIAGRPITFEEAAGALINGFKGRFEIIATNVPVSEAVSEAAERLEKKYGSDEWNLGRDPSAR